VALPSAEWGDNYNPSDDATTFDSQSTFIFPFTHADGHTTFVWMADRNAKGPGGIDNMTLVWLPLLPPKAPLAARWSLPWLDAWSLKDY
jgi:hypothetical protein